MFEHGIESGSERTGRTARAVEPDELGASGELFDEGGGDAVESADDLFGIVGEWSVCVELEETTACVRAGQGKTTAVSIRLPEIRNKCGGVRLSGSG